MTIRLRRCLRLTAPRPEARPPMSSQSRPSRSPARLDPWTLAALLATPCPLPPAPLFPRCASRSDQRPQVAGGRGLRSLPAVFAGARPALTLTAVDCFPGPLLSGAANLTGDTPRPLRAGDRGPTLTVDSIRSLSATPAAVSPCGAFAAPIAGVRRLPVRPAVCTRASRRPRASRDHPATASPGSGQVDTRAVFIWRSSPPPAPGSGRRPRTTPAPLRFPVRPGGGPAARQRFS